MNNGKRLMNNFVFLLVFLVTYHLSLVTAQAQIAIKGETVWTMASGSITDGVVVIGANGKIEAVGPEATVKIPAGYKVITAKVVTPGLIDAHTTVGLSGYLNQPHDQMQLETSAPMQPELRAIDAYDPDERLVEWIRGFGITTINTGHSLGSLISGQTMVIKTDRRTADEAMIPTAMVAGNLGESSLGGQGKSPGTRAKQISMLRAELIKADAASKKTDAGGSRDIRAEMFVKIIKREVPLMITANRVQDIESALRLQKEFNFRLILDGASEAYLVIPDIKAAGVPVIIHPGMARAGGETENLSMETASKLKAAGILVATQSGYEGYVPKTRVVLYEAAVAAANGMSQRDALAMITIDAAKLLGIDKQVGSLEVGKDGDVAMYDGDPFEYVSHCIGTIIDGKVVSTVVR
jgi:imidazolonepropionase-like amidohydrolase